MQRIEIYIELETHFVSADERGLCGDGPVALGSVKISVADTGAVELDETLARGELLRLRDGDLGDFEGGPCRSDDGGLHGLWDGVGGGSHSC